MSTKNSSHSSTERRPKLLTKTAVDSVAEEYWISYYEDSGYGKTWVRKIPKRVQAALIAAEDAPAKKQASKKNPAEITPLATIVTKSGVSLEGLATTITNGTRQVKAFVAEFSHAGDITDFSYVNVI